MKYNLSGPLDYFSKEIYDDLVSQRYAESTIGQFMYIVADLNRWLKKNHLALFSFNEKQVLRFVKYRQRKQKRLGTVGILRPILNFFWKRELIPKWQVKQKKLTPLDLLIKKYELYLINERGLGPETTFVRKKYAYEFLLKYTGKKACLEKLRAQNVRAFILWKMKDSKKTRAILFATCLRSLFQYLFVSNLTKINFSICVPSIAGWRLRSLPRAVAFSSVKKLLVSCNRKTCIGLRDYAILMLLAHLGLRAGEVAALKLESLQWRKGVISILSKGNRIDLLPLPKKVGQAITDYLKNGRYKTHSRKLFLKEIAPGSDGLKAGGIVSIVGAACERAQIKLTSHQLRHTVATEILHNGGTLKEIAQVLRHQSISTTAIYAKVDRPKLRLLAKKWPGGM